MVGATNSPCHEGIKKLFHHFFKCDKEVSMKQEYLKYKLLLPYTFQEYLNNPLHIKVYVFNVTNKDEWLAGQGRVKLKLDEIGPLVYRFYLLFL